MTGIVFLVGVIAFVVVAYWTYTNDRLKLGAGEQGILAMKDLSSGGAATRPRIARWKRGVTGNARPKRGPGPARGRLRPPHRLPNYRRP